MGKPNPTKRIPTTRLGEMVMIRDESDDFELLAFENGEAARLFEACLNDSGYGSAYGGYEVEWPDMDRVRQTQGYRDWLAAGQRVISLAYLRYVSDRMDADPDCDVSGDLLNRGETPDAYAPMAEEDGDILYPEDAEDKAEDDTEVEAKAPDPDATSGRFTSTLLGASFEKYPGVFVRHVEPGSVAEKMGLKKHKNLEFINRKADHEMTLREAAEALETEGTVIWFASRKYEEQRDDWGFVKEGPRPPNPVLMHEVMVRNGKVHARVVASSFHGFLGKSPEEILQDHGIVDLETPRDAGEIQQMLAKVRRDLVENSEVDGYQLSWLNTVILAQDLIHRLTGAGEVSRSLDGTPFDLRAVDDGADPC